MRFLLKTQPYENTIASGTYSYRFSTLPVGSDEHWRYTNAAEGYRFFRIDEDARESDGATVLYHGVLNPDGHWENIKFRYYTQGPSPEDPRIEGQLLFEEDQLTLIRTIGKDRKEEAFESGIPFLMRSAAGLNFFLHWQMGDTPPERVLTFGKDFEVDEKTFEIESLTEETTLVTLGNSKIELTLRDDRLAAVIDWKDGDMLAKATRLVRVQKKNG